MIKGSLRAMAEAIGGTVIGSDGFISGVTTDSRQPAGGRLFVALRGERFDGHDFGAAARERGAAALLVERPLPLAIPQWIVPDTRRALGQLAAFHRKGFPGHVIAITGSNGKTTCKEMIAAILAQVGRVRATQGNRNNEIGLPLTLLESDREDFLVLEMGANHPGEIRGLTAIARPDRALITSIGRAHLAGFGSLEGVARAKAEIVQGLAPEGALVIPADLPPAFSVPRGPFQVLTCGEEPGAAVRLLGAPVTRWDSEGFRTEFQVQLPQSPPLSFSLRLGGRHSVQNALLAIGIAQTLGIEGRAMRAGLAQMAPVPGRLVPRMGSGGWRLLDDTYNANPDSVRAAFAVLTALPGRSVAVLGDLAELGPEGDRLHHQLGETARAMGIQALYTVGSLSRAASRGFGAGGRHFPDQPALIRFLARDLRPGDSVLIKGSRSAAMERVVDALAIPGGNDHAP